MLHFSCNATEKEKNIASNGLKILNMNCAVEHMLDGFRHDPSMD